MAEGNKHDSGKPRLDLIPPEAMFALGRVLAFGAQKYADRNWEKGFAWGRSVAALLRHLFAWIGGQDKDPETGFCHLDHVLCNVVFLVTFWHRNVGTDDRPKMPEVEPPTEAAPLAHSVNGKFWEHGSRGDDMQSPTMPEVR